MGGLSLLGYVLEPPRVGGSNSPFTSTPNVFIADQATFDAYYTPGAEPVPRTEYHVFVLTDGDLPEATFCWTKNEVINRFDHNGREQRFQTLFGNALEVAGDLALDSNTNRLSVSKPLSSDTVSYPVRISIGTDSGTTFPVTVVADDSSFGSPAAGTVELSQATGNLNWNTGDLTTFEGQPVRFQRQTFYAFTATNGSLGTIGDALLLNPLPATGQYPLLRIGYSTFATPVEVANEGSFSANPGVGVVEWARNTGRLNFDPIDIANNAGRSVYYEGVVLAFGVQVDIQSWGTVSSPTTFGSLPPSDSDIFFRVPGTHQFATTVFVSDFSAWGKRDQVEIKTGTGEVRFSFVDQILYGSQAVQLVIGDLAIERGIKLRLFRSPVDLQATDPDTKDASAFYTAESATLADPIIQSPVVNLPANPLEDLTLTIEVQQGTGTYTGFLNRLDVATPPSGYGYVLDLDNRQFQYARRRVQVVSPQSALVPYSVVQLPDPLLSEVGALFELETAPGAGTYTALEEGRDVLVNYQGGLATLILSAGHSVVSGAAGSFLGTTFTDLTQDFSISVSQGDILLIPAGVAEGVYTVDSVGTTSLQTDLAGPTASNIAYSIHEGTGVNAPEILADRYFRDVPALDPNTRIERLLNLGTTTNSPRLTIPTEWVNGTIRFRFGTGAFSTTVTVVANSTLFTAPASLPQGEVEVAEDNGELNFSADDVTAALAVYWARTLEINTDFQLQAGLGFIEFTERMLEEEEVYVTYAIINDNDEQELVEERGSFIVRKEMHQGTGSATIAFNPYGREVAADPEPQAFRGGRPQVNGEQVTVNITTSTFTWLPSDQITDALPAGPPVDTTERVYIDYYVYGAIGGEKSITVLQPPMVGVNVQINEGDTTFTIAGDRTTDFKANYLLRVDKSEVYLMSGSAYDAGTGLTTVSLTSPQTFKSDLLNPSLSVTSGATRTSSFFLFPSYFVTDTGYDTTPRGSNRFRIAGDKARIYTQGTVVLWTDGGSIFDFNIVEGSVYDENTGKTEVVLASNGFRQYTAGSVTLKRSVRPILPSPTAAVTTDRSPSLDEGYTVYRRVEGEIGQVLSEPADYSIDSAGSITFTEPLQQNEELAIIYKGNALISDGRNFRSTYTNVVAPSEANGLQGQILKATYTTYIPDSYYFRVETFTNFRGEIAQQYEADAKAAVPSGGPVLANASQPTLYEQGRESAFYPEGRLYNEDEVARPTLKYFNDAVNYLEDCLQSMDGRVVGDHDGRFLFDGNIDNPTRATYADVTNQIDDLLKVADPPVQITFSPFAILFLGTYQEAYKAASFSRFYPTKRNLYSMTADPTGLSTGDTILDTGAKPLAKVTQISRRLPWAVVTRDAQVGATTLYVDTADGEENLFRPAFAAINLPMSCVVQERDGTVLYDDFLAPLVVSARTATSLTVPALTVAVPKGSTIRAAIVETGLPIVPYLKYYRPNFDVGVNLQEGVLTHVVPFPPFDGTFPAVPAELEIQNPGAGEILDVFADLNNTLTSPDRPPAFDGGTADDDNNRQFPILTPWPGSENGDGIGLIDAEQAAIANILINTTAPFVGIGDLDVARNTITNQGGAWPSPIPKVYDIVTINNGLNGPSTYRRIVAVGADYIDIDPSFPFAQQDTGFSFTVTTSNSLVTSSGTIGPGVTRLTDGTANYYVAQVKVGHTVVITSGVIAGERRQVTAIVSATELDIDAVSAIGTFNYRIDDSVPTFGGATGSLVDTDLIPALDGELAVLTTNSPPDPWNEQDALELFLDHVLTDIISPVPTNGQTTAATPTLTDNTVDFTQYTITAAHFVYIETGADAGFYQIEEVAPLGDIHKVNVDSSTPFPATLTGVTYRVVSALGATLITLTAVFDALAHVTTAVTNINDFKTLITTTVPVVLGGTAFATRTTNTDLNSRLGETATRQTQLTDPAGDIANIESALSSGDRLYDTRFTWIDARINLEKGILPKKDRAVTERLKQQAETLKQLTKLLTTRVT